MKTEVTLKRTEKWKNKEQWIKKMILLDEVNLCLPKDADPAPPRGNEKRI